MSRSPSEKCTVHVQKLGRVIEGRVYRVPGGFGFFYRNSLGIHHCAKIEEANIVRWAKGAVLWFEVKELSVWDGPAY